MNAAVSSDRATKSLENAPAQLEKKDNVANLIAKVSLTVKIVRKIVVAYMPIHAIHVQVRVTVKMVGWVKCATNHVLITDGVLGACLIVPAKTEGDAIRNWVTVYALMDMPGNTVRTNALYRRMGSIVWNVTVIGRKVPLVTETQESATANLGGWEIDVPTLVLTVTMATNVGSFVTAVQSRIVTT